MSVKISRFIFVIEFLSLGIYQVFKRDHYDSKWSYQSWGFRFTWEQMWWKLMIWKLMGEISGITEVVTQKSSPIIWRHSGFVLKKHFLLWFFYFDRKFWFHGLIPLRQNGGHRSCKNRCLSVKESLGVSWWWSSNSLVPPNSWWRGHIVSDL